MSSAWTTSSGATTLRITTRSGPTPREVIARPHTPGHHGIDAEFFERQIAPHEFVTAALDRTEGVGTPDDQEIRVTARFQGVGQALHKVLHGDDVLQPPVVGGTLGIDLVLDVDAGDPRDLKLPHTAHDVQRIPVPGASVRQ